MKLGELLYWDLKYFLIPLLVEIGIKVLILSSLKLSIDRRVLVTKFLVLRNGCTGNEYAHMFCTDHFNGLLGVLVCDIALDFVTVLIAFTNFTSM